MEKKEQVRQVRAAETRRKIVAAADHGEGL